MNVHILDPRLVEQALETPCCTLHRRYESSVITAPFCWFEIGPDDKKVRLNLQDREPYGVHITFGLRSPGGISISFESITRVAYDIEGHSLILESHTPTHASILWIHASGLVELVTGLDVMKYEGTGYDERFREVTEKHDRRLQELRTMPYQEYLLTPEWQERRKMQLARSDYRCQVCNAGQRELQVHHRTYERRGDEAPGDLVTLCRECHDLFHRAGKLVEEDKGNVVAPHDETLQE